MPIFFISTVSTTMPIFVRTRSERIINLNVKPSSNIRDVKEILLGMEGIPPRDQYFYFAGVQLLQDDRSLSYYDIYSGSRLELFHKNYGPLNLNVVSLDGKTTHSIFGFSGHECVSELKGTVAEVERRPPQDVRLVYYGRELKTDRYPVAHYCLHDEATIRRVGPPEDQDLVVFIGVHPSLTSIQLRVHSTTTISRVKDMIEERGQIPRHLQALSLPLKRLDDDDQTLAGYFVEDDSSIDVFVLGVRVSVRIPGRAPIPIWVQYSDTISDLKAMIESSENDLTVARLSLFMDGDEMEDERTVEDYGIHSDLFVIHGQVQES